MSASPGAVRARRCVSTWPTSSGCATGWSNTSEVDDERYASNPVDRCYFCKTHLYTELEQLAARLALRYILNGLNVDDLGDWRPGARAAAERPDEVRSPLHEAGMGKTEIRAAARELGLPNWDKPALACLSSRVPYGERVTPEKLARIGLAEQALHALGFRQLRVRHFADRARVEIAPDELGRVAAEGSGARASRLTCWRSAFPPSRSIRAAIVRAA